ncbi:hypothetical protein EPUL_003186 [Erysiphe pulchra]|uniref:ubiquitinyl hydrolase 1 n=1 Tax=Erysiphe pulchra TaxID=225359 RepID=A0A2S4PXL0_9PEZI|nr:hypothetical protein EPUL_003186 [Erysiphe pulchra]
MAQSSDTMIEILLNHIALPARLPGRQDENPNEIETQLVRRLLKATKFILDIPNSKHFDCWSSLYRSLLSSKSVNENGGLSASEIITALRELKEHDFVLLHLTEQNAGVTVTLQNSGEVKELLFEVSEASAESENVLASSNALLWEFPTSAVALPLSSYFKYDLEHELATFLAQAGNESVKHVASHTNKADSQAYESRDTIDPVIISGILMTILKGRGRKLFSPVLRKRIRDDVCWDGTGVNPWRRSPMWLLLRVAVERHLCAFVGLEIGHLYYKLLMCLFHSNFLIDYTKSSQIQEDLLQHLIQKLVTRVDKLYNIDSILENDSTLHFIVLRSKLEKKLQNSVERSANILSEMIRIQNNSYEDISTVHRMPFRAQDKYCRLKLLNSDAYISEVLNSSARKKSIFTCHFPKNDIKKVSVPEYIISATELYLRSAKIESQIETLLQQYQSDNKSNDTSEVHGQAIAESIEDYLKKVGDSYDDSPEQKSKMLLIVLELWVELDKCTIQTYRLLKNFSPGIPCEITNVLLFPHMEDLQRLSCVQKYLIKRHKESGDSTMTIFDQPSKNCFAVQYYNNLSDHSVMKQSHNKIEKDAQEKREIKKRDLSKASKKFRLKVAKESVMSHKIFNERHDMGKCPKCYRKREINKSKIDVHEWPLPSELIHIKTVIFELHCPKLFSIYRDISWMIIADLALVSILSKDPKPELLLGDYAPLFTYATTQRKASIKVFNRSSRFTLASKAKLFNKTHYKTVKLPAGEDDVCVRNGARFEYFDAKKSVWLAKSLQLSFVHHFNLIFPKESSYSSLNKFLGFTENRPGPSSYSILASRPRCPGGILIQEFLSIQSLFTGYEHRWLQILIELGSSNINFSTESTSSLMNFLILQVGPRDSNDARGITHRIFLDRKFCTRLVYWVNLRLNEISSVVRRREIFCMEILITLSVRLFELGSPSDKKEGFNLVTKARDITINWLSKIEEDIKNAKCFEMSEKFSRYATWAALLCRRTYVVFSETKEGEIPPSIIFSYLDSTIALQEYLSDNKISLDFSLKAALIRDAKIVWKIRYHLSASLTIPILISVIKRYISNLAFTPTSNESSIKFLSSPQEWFISILTEKSTRIKQQHIILNLLTGHLLIDGKPMGKLPDEWRQSEIYKTLFNTEIIHVWPSQLSGMDYKLNRVRYGHEVHFGTRAGKKIIQAITQSEHLEFIPSEIFSGVPTSDLPAYLVNECAHWLNFRTKCIEIRQISNCWRYGPTDWSIDLNERIVLRYKSNKRWILIDPHSTLFKAITHIFKGFEKYNEIVVIQADKGGMKLSIPRLELKFHINENRLFECSELGSEIDPNQDIRSWYGLKSKLVLRGVARSPVSQTYYSKTRVTTTHRRSILVPTGNIHCERIGAYVEVKVANNGSYARFLVNEVLGRIETVDSSDEYLKALYHAVTSRLIPDHLTGRTGTEEAIHCLNSAYCQPAIPLSNPQKLVLHKIANLTPNREFYPKHMKSMQKTSWNEDLTTSIQYDGFRHIVDQILEKSQQLSLFFDDPSEPKKILNYKIDKLNERNLVRRNTYCRWKSTAVPTKQSDSPYSGHKMIVYLSNLMKVQKCTQFIQNWSQSLPTTKNLGEILARWSSFQGFGPPITEFLISDLIDIKISNHWGSLVNTMRNFHKSSMYRLTFFLGIISFSNDIDMDLITTLIAYSVCDKLKELEPPNCLYYDKYKVNEKPTIKMLLNRLKTIYTLEEGSENEAHALNLLENLLIQWPCAKPCILQTSDYGSFNADEALNIIRPEWLRMFQNYELSNYLSQLKDNLDSDCQKQNSVARDFSSIKLPELHADILSGDLFSKELQDDAQTRHFPVFKSSFVSEDKNTPIPFVTNELYLKEISSQGALALKEIIQNLSTSNIIIEKQYAKDLFQSLDKFEAKIQVSRKSPQILTKNLPQAIENAHEVSRRKLKFIQDCCENFIPFRSKWLKKAGLWPCISSVSLLESLRSRSNCKFGPRVKEYLIDYAVSITKLQQLYRIHDAIVKQNYHQVAEEVENRGHKNWDPISYPDWLLLEIDGNILIRPGQVDVAHEIICPKTRKNSVLQLNMGQGKTSCIMPMAASILANGNSLTRVIIPRALLAQTLVLLQTRLGGLVGREVKHIPFSRSLSKQPNIANRYLNQLQHTQEIGGIFVTLPEHILSFKLSGHQFLSDGKIKESKYMFEVQKWISKKSRDIIDECDEILSLRTQLIYPSGTRKVIDGQPYRWEIIETLLRLVNFHVDSLEKTHPQSINVSRRNDGSFPFFCFVKFDAENLLVARLVDDICSGQSQIIPTYSLKTQSAIKDFISIVDVSNEVVHKIDSLDVKKPIFRQAIYLLRGLLAHKILITTLKKRWNVQYGLHPERSPIAVPYHAKGCPSNKSEWGHPDVAIILTCLAFYYEGMKLEQFCKTLKHVHQTDDPIRVYNNLIQGNIDLPDSFQDWNNVNIEDDSQINEISQYLYRNVNMINFFLNKTVFPRYAKQYEYNLQATSWDIPALNLDDTQNDKSIVPLTTGFSGTNDWKRLLPLTISQQDLTSLSHTNAEVLTYLLEQRNMGYVYATNSNGRRFSELDLLHSINDRKISVLLDAGAQIMEMDNLSLVRAWMNINLQASAAFYFDKDNKPRILYRNGGLAPFYSTTFSENLEGCLVYLDQVHTRGTDLKLPPLACGALTLGPNQTKDHTVQAAMRLRQLGTTQTIMFFAPPEVHQSILNLQRKEKNEKLTSFDVVSWLLKQSCLAIQQSLPLYFLQGYEFCRRSQASLTYLNLFDVTSSDREKFLSVVRPCEDRTLDELYGTKKKKKQVLQLAKDPITSLFLKELNEQTKDFMGPGGNNNSVTLSQVFQEVEQDHQREVAKEAQAVHQLQNPFSYDSLVFPGLHKDILKFIKKGTITTNAVGYEQAFDFIARTSIGKKYVIKTNATSQKLFVSAEFGKTVSRVGVKNIDHIHRPVHWILWSPSTETAIIIIPEEVEVIIPILRNQSCNVHLLTYAAPMTRKMLIFNDFTHYSLPPLSSSWCAPFWLRIEVGILTGRLYFDYSEYPKILETIGVKELDGKIIENSYKQCECPQNSSTGFLKVEKAKKGFTSKPLCFLQEWIALRTQGQDFNYTPMGLICQGRPVKANDLSCTRINCSAIDCTSTIEHESQSRAIYEETMTKESQEENKDDPLAFDSENDGHIDDDPEQDQMNFSDSE